MRRAFDTAPPTAADGRVHGNAHASERVRPLLARDYVAFEGAGAARGLRLMPPTATVTLILNVGPAFSGLPDAFVAGIEQQAITIEPTDATSCIDLKLTPLGAFTLLGGMPLHEITGRSVEIRDVLGRTGAELAEAVRETSSWQPRFALVNRFLEQRLAEGPRPSPAIAWAWRELVRSGGQVRITDLAEQSGWSRRHFIARCKEQLGLPPKPLATILRFERLIRQLDRAPAPALSVLALEHGYYDQSHLNRDFRRFTGMSPTEFLAQRSLV